jgi:hypothetical protein
MSIAAIATKTLSKLRRSVMFARRFMESLNVRETCIGTMNRPGLLPLRYLSRLARGWRRGQGRGGHHPIRSIIHRKDLLFRFSNLLRTSNFELSLIPASPSFE